MRTTRLLRWLVVASVLVKLSVWGTWWAGAVFAESRPAGAAGPPTATAGLPPQLLEQSRGFRELLDAVAQRQQELDAREQALKDRETGLSQLEKVVAEQVTKLEALAGVPSPAEAGRGATPGRPGAAGAAGTDRAAEITKIYETMKPEEAAPILDKLDDDTLRAILGRMKERQIGAILAAMNRERAVAFTKSLAGTAR